MNTKFEENDLIKRANSPVKWSRSSKSNILYGTKNGKRRVKIERVHFTGRITAAYYELTLSGTEKKSQHFKQKEAKKAALRELWLADLKLCNQEEGKYES